MPRTYRRDAPRLKAEIVARTDAGETLCAVCASPGLPSELTVRRWASDDAAFGEALAAARRRGAWRRLWAFDEAKAAAFLARWRAGEPMVSLFGQPGMPSRRAYERWKTSQPPFTEVAFALRRRRDAQLGERGRARFRAFDQALADRIVVALNRGFADGLRLRDVLAADPELPCRPTLARWRREQPEFDRVLRMIFAARRAAIKPVPEVFVEEVVDHIVEGGSFLSFSRIPGAPAYTTLRRWMRDPSFAAEVAEACEWREEWLWGQVEDIAMRTPPGPIRQMERAIGPLKRQIVRLRNRPTKPLIRKKPGSPLSRG
jgi:hypothetical protein